MPRISIPKPPYHTSTCHSMVQEGLFVAHIWAFSEKGLAAIENQYKTAAQIMQMLKCSRATAYRIIKRHKKRYWLCDMRPSEPERCFSVLPVELLSQIEVQPVGNPNFRNGVYQQGIARRPRRRR